MSTGNRVDDFKFKKFCLRYILRNRTGNFLLTRLTLLTTGPSLRDRYEITWNIAVYEVKIQKRKLQPRNRVVAGSTMDIWLGVTNEICLQHLNLSSSQVSVFNSDLALLQQAMNAEGICSPSEWKHNTQGWISLNVFTRNASNKSNEDGMHSLYSQPWQYPQRWDFDVTSIKQLEFSAVQVWIEPDLYQELHLIWMLFEIQKGLFPTDKYRLTPKLITSTILPLF